jgi:DNA-binding SARP family transcriptional activator/TolB-like protein/Tfp pilus assembly protein PilF
MNAPPCIGVRLLGRFAVTIDGDALTPMRISSRKGRALLAYLAMHPEHCADREELATLLWGDRPNQQARLSLRQCILSLRNTLGEAGDILVFEGDTVALRMHHLRVDALDFEKLARSAEAGNPERAAHLYGGEFLSDLRIEAEGFAHWLAAERTRLTTIAARVFESWIEQLDMAGHGQQAIDAADRLVALDPLREDWQRRMLRLCARHQGRDVTLARAKALVALLKVELEVEPEPATNALIDEIRRGAIALAEPSQGRSLYAIDLDGQAPAAWPGNRAISPSRADEGTTTIVPAARMRTHSFSPRNFRTLAIAVVFLATFVSLGFLAQRHSVWTDKASAAIAFPISIGVLPFEVLGTSGGSDAVANLLSDDLVNVLSRVSSLKVVSRLRSQQKPGRPKDVATLSHELGVQYLLDGTVRVEEDRLHLNVELIETSSGLQVWSSQFDRGPADSSAIRQEAVRGLGRMLEIEAMTPHKERAATRPPQPPTIDEMVAAGWAALYGSAGANSTLLQAEALFRKALQRDPENPSAMLGLAAQHIIAVGNLVVPEPEPYLGDAAELIDRILVRNPESSAAHYHRGLLQKIRAELQPALASFERSVALNPSFAPGYAQIGQVLTSLGHPEEGLDQIRYAMRLSPEDPTMPSWDIFAGQAELELGHDKEALEWLLRAVALSPNSRFANGSLAAAYALAGDSATAMLYTTKFKALTEGVSNERRLQMFGAFLPLPSPHRTAEGLRAALGDSG